MGEFDCIPVAAEAASQPAGQGQTEAPHSGGEATAIECRYHHGVTRHEPEPGETAEQAAYRLMRESHHFLTDDNHTWVVAPAERPEWFSRINVIKNERSGYFRFKPWWVDDGPGAHWFSHEWRVATLSMVRIELAALGQQAEGYRERAEDQRDTFRGRKEAKRLRSIASELERQQRVLVRRWPELLGPEFARTGATGEAQSTGTNKAQGQADG